MTSPPVFERIEFVVFPAGPLNGGFIILLSSIPQMFITTIFRFFTKYNIFTLISYMSTLMLLYRTLKRQFVFSHFYRSDVHRTWCEASSTTFCTALICRVLEGEDDLDKQLRDISARAGVWYRRLNATLIERRIRRSRRDREALSPLPQTIENREAQTKVQSCVFPHF